MKEPKFKKGDIVFADTLGKGIVTDSYHPINPKKEYYYHIKQGVALLGNVPENWIVKIKRKSV